MKKKAALYDPYLDILGGGEKHILSVLRVLEDHGYEPEIFWDNDMSLAIRDRLNLHFSHLTFRPNIFNNSTSQIQKFRQLLNLDIFLYVTDGSYFFSAAKKNYVFCMVPQKSLYPQTFLDKTKTSNYNFISNSEFTKNKLSGWGIKSQVVYPYIDQEYIDLGAKGHTKEKVILSVGRFFSHLHSKKHDHIIATFQKLKEKSPQFKEYKLILAGSAKHEDYDYLKNLQKLIGEDNSIVLKLNIPFHELLKLYKSAQFYWHFTGYGVDEDKHPEQVEHLGITPLEAMASGAITFCYNAGGPKEIIVPGKTGFLFDTDTELIDLITQIEPDSQKQNEVRGEVKQFISQYFSYTSFSSNVATIFNL